VAAVAVTLLVVGVSGSIARPWRLPAWVFPVGAALAALAIGALAPTDAWDAARPLVEPIAFLLLAVPLAVLLDDLGVFAAAARLAAGRHLAWGLWLVSAVAVAVLNLDAAVVLCTPLAITMARRTGLDPVAMAFQPALLACLASSALPVSNLTNLIAIAEGRVDTGTLLAHMTLPTVVAVVVGYAAWRLAFRHRPLHPTAPGPTEPVSRRAVVVGAVVLTVLLTGFLPGRLLGIEPWMVVAVVDAGLVIVARTVPWRAVPWGTAAVAAGLAIVAAAAAERAGAADWLVASGTWDQALRGAVAANLLNNLPAFLVALPHTASTDQVLALLFGVNVGPTILVTGSLAGLLWLDAARRHGLAVGARDYARVGLLAGVPALLAGIAVLAVSR
jgi:arsenical pump membrane protein